MQRRVNMFRGGSLTLFRVRGVPVRAHWTLLIVLPYFAFVFATAFPLIAAQAGVDPRDVALPPLVWGFLIAIALFASVAFHELVHTLIAVRVGGRVREVTLMLLGGVSQIEHLPRRPAFEALVAGGGPLSSLGLAAVLWLGLEAPLPAELRLGVFYLAQLNLILGVFNLLPAFPMDGGRVLRAALVRRLGVVRATRIAAAVGKGLAIALALLALWIGNFLLLFISLFLYGGAEAEVRAQEFRDAIDRVRVSDLMATRPTTISIDETLDAALVRMREASRLELVVIDAGGAPVGVLRAGDLATIPDDARAALTARRLLPEVSSRGITVDPDEPAGAALDAAAAAGADVLYVVSGDELIGVVGRAELDHAMTLRSLRRRVRPFARGWPRTRPDAR